jgi:hypothetical protein
MKRTTIVQALLALAFLVLPAVSADASTFMTFVSSTGNDANDCSSPAPANACRHISRALVQTSFAGEITCVDSADYIEASVTIAQSVTINCASPGNFPNLVVNAANIVVTLRNLDRSNTAAPLVDFRNGAALTLENVHWFGAGTTTVIRFAPTADAQLIVSDCLIRDDFSSQVGILIKPASGVRATFTVQRTVVASGQFGIAADGTNGGSITGMVRDSVVTGNTQAGIITQGAGANVTVSVDNVSVTGNGNGLWAQDGTAILTRRSFITGNITGVQANGSGAVFSYGDNSLNANIVANGAFSASVALR